MATLSLPDGIQVSTIGSRKVRCNATAVVLVVVFILFVNKKEGIDFLINRKSRIHILTSKAAKGYLASDVAYMPEYTLVYLPSIFCFDRKVKLQPREFSLSSCQ